MRGYKFTYILVIGISQAYPAINDISQAYPHVMSTSEKVTRAKIDGKERNDSKLNPMYAIRDTCPSRVI